MKSKDVLRDRTFRVGLFLVLSMLVIFSSVEAWALQTIRMNLERITQQSGRIVEGVVLSAAEGYVQGPGEKSVPVMEYVLSVSNALKGKKDATVVVRHIRLPGLSVAPDSGSGMSSGFPTYIVGEHLVLFLTQESQLGLSSPVGLMQGVFQVQKDKNGQPTRIVNRINNAGLFEGMNNNSSGKPTGMKRGATGNTRTKAAIAMPLQTGGAVSYSEFMSVVNNIVSGQ